MGDGGDSSPVNPGGFPFNDRDLQDIRFYFCIRNTCDCDSFFFAKRKDCINQGRLLQS